MAIAYTCDGCGQSVPVGEAHKYGSLAPVYYCTACDEAWRAYLEREKEERTRLVTAFEAWRTNMRQILRRDSTRRLPDE